jgi:hypothetical protein
MQSPFKVSVCQFDKPIFYDTDPVFTMSKGRRNAYLQQKEARQSADPHFIEADTDYRTSYRNTPPIQIIQEEDIESELATKLRDISLEEMRDRISSTGFNEETSDSDFIAGVNEYDIDDESDFYFGDDDDSVGKATENTEEVNTDDDLFFEMDM